MRCSFCTNKLFQTFPDLCVSCAAIFIKKFDLRYSKYKKNLLKSVEKLNTNICEIHTKIYFLQ